MLSPESLRSYPPDGGLIEWRCGMRLLIHAWFITLLVGLSACATYQKCGLRGCSGDAALAVNPTTGKQIWAYHPTDMVSISTLPLDGPRDNHGVAYGQGLIFLARLDAQLVALDAKTGAVVWKTVVDLSSNGAAMTVAPQFIGASDGKIDEVIVGVTGGEHGVRGHLDAYLRARGSFCGVSGPLSPIRGLVTLLPDDDNGPGSTRDALS
jgi:outer membrane protein assembly factor BamB